MKNKLLIGLSLSAVALVGVVSVSSIKSKERINNNKRSPNNFNQAAANTYNDNIRAFSAQLLDVKKDNQKLKNEIRKLEHDNRKLSGNDFNAIMNKANVALEKKLERMANELRLIQSNKQGAEGNELSGKEKRYQISSIRKSIEGIQISGWRPEARMIRIICIDCITDN